jgi:hypothetical protein
MKIISGFSDCYFLIEEQGEKVLREYLINVLGYTKGKNVDDLSPKYMFEYSIKTYDHFLVRYEINDNNEKILLGFILISKAPFERHENILLICGIDIKTVNKLLEQIMRPYKDYEDVHMSYYFPENLQVKDLFESNGFELVDLRKPLFKKDHRIMVLKYIRGELLLT